MIQKLKQSSTSTNFWNNLSTIGSLATLIVLVSLVKDPETVKQMVWAFMSASGFYNAGNVLAHLNKPK